MLLVACLRERERQKVILTIDKKVAIGHQYGERVGSSNEVSMNLA